MPDIPSVKVVGRYGITMLDGPDLDAEPDVIWCDSGAVVLTPLSSITKVAGGVPVPWTAGHAEMVLHVDSEGYVTLSGARVFRSVDLGSPAVNPTIPAGKATHKLTFRNMKANGTFVQFQETTVRLSADTVDPITGVCDLTLLTPVPTAGGTPIIVGPRGEQGEPGPEGPQGAPGGSDAATAERITNGTATRAALGGRYGAAVNLPPSNGSDDTATVQAILDAAAALTATPRVLGVPGQTYYTSGWTIASGVTLDMTGCTIVRRASGKTLLRNAAHLGTGARDRRIAVIGGTWSHRSDLAAGPTSHDLHTMMFHRVDGITVTDATFTDTTGATGSKYALHFCDVTRYRATGIRFTDRPSDGIHVSGPARNGHLARLSGKTGDDFIGVTGCDYTAYQATPGGGDIENLTIEDLDLEGAASGVLLLPGQGAGGALHTVRKVTVRNVRGTTTSHAIRINDDDNYIGTTGGIWEDITFENISATPGVGYGAPRFFITSAGKALGSVMKNVTVRGSTLPSATSQIIVDGAAITNLTIDGIATTTDHTAGAVDIKAGSNVSVLSIAHARATLGTGGYVLKQAGAVSALHIQDWAVTGATPAAALLYGTTGTVNVTNTRSERDTIQVNGATEAPVIRASNCEITAAGYALVRVTHTTATATLLGSGITGRAIDRSSTQAIRASGAGLQADAAKLTPQSGDKIHNVNAGAAGCPVAGAVTYDGTSWRADKGFFASGVVTLAAGTVTVTNAAITAASEIAVELYAPAGTPGVAYVSARTAGTGFTITSTSASDTSQVRWRLLRT